MDLPAPISAHRRKMTLSNVGAAGPAFESSKLGAKVICVDVREAACKVKPHLAAPDRLASKGQADQLNHKLRGSRLAGQIQIAIGQRLTGRHSRRGDRHTIEHGFGRGQIIQPIL